MAMGSPFQPTHTVPVNGQDTWGAPDPNQPRGPRLPPRLEVQLVEQQGAWARVRCSNEFTAWVDGRLLVARAPAPPPQPPRAPTYAPPPQSYAPQPTPTYAQPATPTYAQ